MGMQKQIFIGSSSESRELVDEIAAWIQEAGQKPIPWPAIFEEPGTNTLAALCETCRNVDAAVFIFAPDDLTLLREKLIFQPRGNVLLEYGLFAGVLGPKRAAVVLSGDKIKAAPVSDLDGILAIHLEARDDYIGKRKLKAWARKLSDEAAPANEIRHVHPSFPIDEFRAMLKNASEVRILQTFMPIDSHLDVFRDDLKNAIRNGCNVQILICDPSSEAIFIRESALRKHAHGELRSNTVRSQVEDNIREMGLLYHELCDDPDIDVKTNAPGRLNVMTYSTLPSMSIYQIDDTFICGSYYHETLAINAPQLRVHGRETILGARLMKEITSIWDRDDSSPVSLNDVQSFINPTDIIVSPEMVNDLIRIDALEKELIDKFKCHPILRGFKSQKTGVVRSVLLQRRFLSLAFTPIYDIAIDGLTDTNAKAVVRGILRDEYVTDAATHREDLMEDLVAIGIPRDDVLGTMPSAATRKAIFECLRMPLADRIDAKLRDIRLLAFLRFGAEVLVSTEYSCFWPQLQAMGLSEGSIEEKVASKFYFPHIHHDACTTGIANAAPLEKLAGSHSDYLASFLKDRIEKVGTAGVEHCLSAMKFSLRIKERFYDQFLPNGRQVPKQGSREYANREGDKRGS